MVKVTLKNPQAKTPLRKAMKNMGKKKQRKLARKSLFNSREEEVKKWKTQGGISFHGLNILKK